MTKTLVVLIDGAEIGHVMQDGRGRFHFTYGDAYRQAPAAVPLSVSMPLSEHDDKAVRPFLWGLLPDNDDTLTNWGKRFGVKVDGSFPDDVKAKVDALAFGTTDCALYEALSEAHSNLFDEAERRGEEIGNKLGAKMAAVINFAMLDLIASDELTRDLIKDDAE